MKKRIITGWTNGSPAGHGIRDSEIGAMVCTEKCHRDCGKRMECDRQRPDCHVSVMRMLGRRIDLMKGIPTPSADDMKQIGELLQAAYWRCHKVKITIENEK